MIKISVEGENAVREALRGSPKKVNLVLSRAVNRTVTNVKSNISKEVRERYLIKASDVKASLDVSRATTLKPYAIVKSTGKKIDLTKFRMTPADLKRGENDYSVQVLKNGGKKHVPGFAAKAPTWGLYHRAGPDRYPIHHMMGPAIPEMINRPEIIDFIERQAGTMLEKRLGHELERVMGAKAK